MSGGPPSATGRPLRALNVLGLLLLLWFAARLPLLIGDTATAMAAMQPGAAAPQQAARVSPLLPAMPPPPRLLALASLPPAATPPPVRSSARQRSAPAVLFAAAVAVPPQPQARANGTAPPAIAPIANDTPVAPPASGHEFATAAYASLAAGDRRDAAALFDKALAAGPDPNHAAWQAQRDGLTRRWSGDAYALFRDGTNDPGGGATASPVLGGGQAGASLAWTPDPLARRPVAVFARINAALRNGIDTDSTEAAIGVRWRPTKAITIAGERLIAIGKDGIDEWSLRAAAGTSGTRGRAEWSAYGEADVLGNGDVFAGAQARAGMKVASIGKVTIAADAGGWASIQNSATTIGRVDIGPSIVTRAPIGGVTLEIAADWRFRVAGNAAPGSGPAVTVSTGF